MKADHIGISSGIEYGKMGDKVELLDGTRPMHLVQGKKHKFFVWPDKLSDIPVTAVKEQTDLFGQQPITKKKKR